MLNRMICITAGLLVSFASVVEGQAGSGSPPAPSPKDPGVATLVSVLVTGGGQMYAGETTRGLTMLGIGLGSLMLGAALSTSSCDVSGFEANCSVNTAPMTLGIMVYLGTWVYSIADAPKSVERMRASSRASISNLRPNVGVTRQGQPALGLTFSF